MCTAQTQTWALDSDTRLCISRNKTVPKQSTAERSKPCTNPPLTINCFRHSKISSSPPKQFYFRLLCISTVESSEKRPFYGNIVRINERSSWYAKHRRKKRRKKIPVKIVNLYQRTGIISNI